MRTRLFALMLAILPAAASAAGAITFPFDGSFDDATFAVESAIVNKGLVIEHVSDVGEMLARTAADVGSDVKIFDHARVYLFCSAVVSRQVMEADPMNIVNCPYSIFVIDRGGTVTIGHRDYPPGPMQAVPTLLAGIVADARSE